MNINKFQKKITLVIGLLFFTTTFISIPIALCQTLDITIDVSPNIINIQSNASVLTIHTDIAYSDVDKENDIILIINDQEVPMSWCKADNQGNFVAKFDMNEVQVLNLQEGGYNTFEMIGYTNSNTLFSGSQNILVLNNSSM